MLKRTAFLRKTPTEARLSVPVFKDRKCKAEGCSNKFKPRQGFEVWCSPECAFKIHQAREAANIRKQIKLDISRAKEERKADKEKREAMKGVPQLKKEAQEAFNRYVRLRDNGKGCFVCDTPLQMGGIGGGFDAGHIRSRSNADNLRFDERNVHGQCKPCNAPGATKDWEMRAAAVRKLGEAEAEALYNDNATTKWTRDGLRSIRDTYLAKNKALINAA